MANEKLTSKLGTTRFGPRSRIWIEGKRLIAAGFTPGDQYSARWTAATVTLEIWDGKSAFPEAREIRKVSGKGDKPIIDITGEQVFNTFAGDGRTHVSVSYEAGVITIRRAG